jgi:hypothetical protein
VRSSCRAVAPTAASVLCVWRRLVPCVLLPLSVRASAQLRWRDLSQTGTSTARPGAEHTLRRVRYTRPRGRGQGRVELSYSNILGGRPGSGGRLWRFAPLEAKPHHLNLPTARGKRDRRGFVYQGRHAATRRDCRGFVYKCFVYKCRHAAARSTSSLAGRAIRGQRGEAKGRPRGGKRASLLSCGSSAQRRSRDPPAGHLSTRVAGRF